MDEAREARAQQHQVLAWCHEGLAFVEAELVPDEFREPLYELMEERLGQIATPEALEGPEGEFVEAEEKD